MEAWFLNFLTTLTFWQVIVVVITLSLIYFVYILLNKNSIQSEIYEIKETKRAELWSFISGELLIITTITTSRVKAFIDNLNISECSGVCGLTTKKSILKDYKVVLKDAINLVFEQIKTNMRINHFKNKKGADLDLYIHEKSKMLLSLSRTYISDNCDVQLPLEDDRFSLIETEDFYRKIVNKAIEIKNEEINDIKELKHSYSLIRKLNFVKILLKLFNKIRNN